MREFPRPVPRVKPASTAEALDFVHAIQKLRGRRTHADEARIAAFINSYPLGTLRSIASRVLMDILKAPPAGREPPPDDKRKKPPRRKPKKKPPPSRPKAGPPPRKTDQASRQRRAAPTSRARRAKR